MVFKRRLKSFKKKIELGGRNLVVLDIGTEFLKALFLEVDKKQGKGILRSWVKEKVVDDIEQLYPVCQKAINKVEKKTGIKAEEIFLGINREIVKGTSTSFCYRREKPNQKIDLAELKHLVQKVQWKAFDKIRKAFAAETGFLETQTRLIDANIINIKIDDNSVTNPLGFQPESFCLSIFNTYTSVEQLKVLTRLASQLGLELIGINFSPYALFHCLELEDYSDEDILIIDIGGRITEIILIKNGGEIIEIRDFNLGGQVFTKILADFLGLEADKAEIIKIKYSKGEISFKARKKLEKLFAPNFSSWLGGVKVVVEEFLKNHKSLPKKIFLCGGGSKLPGIRENLDKIGNFKIKFILPREFIKIENRTKLQDIPCLALASLALESFEASEFSFILKRTLRLIQGH